MNDLIMSYLAALVLGTSTLSMGVSALDSAIDDLANSEKVSMTAVCVVKTMGYQVTDLAQKTALEEGCKASAASMVDARYASVKKFIASVQVV